MSFLSLIEAKRDGRPLTPGQFQEMITAFVEGTIPDYQMSAFLMAVFFRGLDEAETRALTVAMRDSGAALEFPKDSRPLVDKHSTGGVGDKISLPLVPLLVSLGFRVPMISGRGLGITGGTLDKLESIPGLSASLPTRRIVEQVQSVGGVICGQTAAIVPADRKLYTLRDVTATVPSVPLITASILSKKLAENLNALVLDVKFGRGAFMGTLGEAKQLALAMLRIATACELKSCALLTRMDAPLGRAAGNWLEVREAVSCLEGKGPEQIETLVIECAARLLLVTRKSGDLETARQRAKECLKSGRPKAAWEAILKAQGADMDAYQRRLSENHTARAVIPCMAGKAGYVWDCDARMVGEIVRDLGGGRLAKDSVIDPMVGIDQLIQVGDRIEKDSVLARIHARNDEEARVAATRLHGAFTITDCQPSSASLIAETLDGE